MTLLRSLYATVASLALAQAAAAQPATAAPTPPAQTTFTVDVIGTTPLPGVDVSLEDIPSPVQTAVQRDLDSSGSLEISSFLTQRLNGVFVNEIQGNPFQADLNYRGYTASPLLGTPQGLSVYMDGVRLNQPFGDVVSWDLIPRLAIASATLMPGSNPVFGLNTLGGALAIQTKDGKTNPGTSIHAIYGSHARRAVEFEHGGAAPRVNWYIAGNLFAEHGWRDESPSDVRQLFAKLRWHGAQSEIAVSSSYANNSLNGNGLQEQRFLARDYASVYTKPDVTDNRAALVNVVATHSDGRALMVSANAYYRRIHANTFNGDLNEDALDQPVYQPTAVERAALAAAGYTGVPVSGANASNTPFPVWRCLANVLLNDAPAERCNGLLNRTNTTQQNFGAFTQLTRVTAAPGRTNQLTIGGGFDGSTSAFQQSTELGYLNPDRSIAGVGAFADGGATGGTIDGAPFDTRVDLDGRVTTWSAYATDTLSVGRAWHLNVAARYNRNAVRNDDRLTPGGGAGSLDGRYTFARLNPSAGVTFSPMRAINLYAGYSEGSRAPTSIELGCANPDEPCKLPNALAGDPPLDQVVNRTWEVGVRSGRGIIRANLGLFRTSNRDDILFVASTRTGFGYFKNFGSTRRQGIEIGATVRAPHATVGAGYTFLSATFESAETMNGAGNSTNDRALAGERGFDGVIQVAPGDRMPLVPRHLFKAYADVQAGARWSIDADLIAVSSSFARGNENNRHQPDGTYYLGPGGSAPYGIVNVGARYQLVRHLQLTVQVNNLFDRRYETAAQLGPTGFTDAATFLARPFPAVNGDFPVQHATFFAPGAPRTYWAGTRVRF